MDGGQDPWHSMGLNWQIGECIDGPGGEGREGGMKVQWQLQLHYGKNDFFVAYLLFNSEGVVMDGGQDPWHSMGLNWRIRGCIDGPGGEEGEGEMNVQWQLQLNYEKTIFLSAYLFYYSEKVVMDGGQDPWH